MAVGLVISQIIERLKRRLWTWRLTYLFYSRKDREKKNWFHDWLDFEKKKKKKKSFFDNWMSSYCYANLIADEDYPEKTPREAYDDALWEEKNSDWEWGWW